MMLISKSRLFSLSLVSGLALALGGCGGSSITEALGYSKDAPDEFSIVTKAPLSIPPDFSLRPPRPGAQRPQELRPTEAAERAVFGRTTVSADELSGGLRSTGEQALLQRADAVDASSEVRQLIAEEGRALVAKNETFVDEVVFWQEKTAPDERLVDAAEESRRLQQNEALGKPVTEGETADIEPRKKGWLEGIF